MPARPPELNHAPASEPSGGVVRSPSRPAAVSSNGRQWKRRAGGAKARSAPRKVPAVAPGGSLEANATISARSEALEPRETPDTPGARDAVLLPTTDNFLAQVIGLEPRETLDAGARRVVREAQKRAEARARDRSEDYLERMGHETARETAARWRAEGHEESAAHLESWANFNVRKSAKYTRLLGVTRSGKPRGLRLALCGVAFVARMDGTIGWERRACRDRNCPSCGEKRSRGLAAGIRAFIERWQLMEHCAFPTLTQPKFPNEDPRAAIDRLLDCWRRFTRSAWFRRNVAGGVRSIEATAREHGDMVGDYEVKMPGIHAHIHAIVQWRPPPATTCPAGVSNIGEPGVVEQHEAAERVARLMHYERLRAEFAEQWVRYTHGNTAAVKVVQLNDENIFQLANYCMNASGLLELTDIAPLYVGRVLEALRGRHLVFAFGGWRGQLDDKDPGTLRFGDRSVATLVAGATRSPPPVEWCGGGEDDALVVLEAVLESPKPLREPRPKTPEERERVREKAAARKARADAARAAGLSVRRVPTLAAVRRRRLAADEARAELQAARAVVDAAQQLLALRVAAPARTGPPEDVARLMQERGDLPRVGHHDLVAHETKALEQPLEALAPDDALRRVDAGNGGREAIGVGHDGREVARGQGHGLAHVQGVAELGPPITGAVELF